VNKKIRRKTHEGKEGGRWAERKRRSKNKVQKVCVRDRLRKKKKKNEFFTALQNNKV